MAQEVVNGGVLVTERDLIMTYNGIKGFYHPALADGRKMMERRHISTSTRLPLPARCILAPAEVHLFLCVTTWESV